jgi:CRISPR/Cas system CSM-associated protein Csm2 small subunit
MKWLESFSQNSPVSTYSKIRYLFRAIVYGQTEKRKDRQSHFNRNFAKMALQEAKAGANEGKPSEF